MKKLTCIIISVLMLISVFAAAPVSAEEAKSAPTGFTTEPALYAHAVLSSDDGEAWVKWQSETYEGDEEIDASMKYFFLPTSADESKVDIYNAFPYSVKLGDTTIAQGECVRFDYNTSTLYDVTAGEAKFTLIFAKSHAEAAIYVNNSDADGEGNDLMTYLNRSKSNSAKATGAIVTPDGKIDNTPIKKIKGRGNTTWSKPKKAYNITYDSKVSIAGMASGKKYSILANYQDDSLSRNRILYDLSDAVGMPYASDSRYVDFYSNGKYLGSYQMCEKVEVGKNTLIPDFEEGDYLDSEGKVNEDFPFVCEVDASAQEGEDYFVTLSNRTKITIKAPELEEGDPGYEEVKNYVKTKFDAFYKATQSRTADLTPYADVDSLAKMYLINELGKNWDSGVSSLFFTYKKDANGEYKFFASPVWDYDNSLGNAVGVEGDLKSAGVTDYTEFTGWWCQYKGKSARQKTSSNIIGRLAQNANILSLSKTIWFEKFVPAIAHFAGDSFSEEINAELYTADAYYNLIKDSAGMNYTSGWLLNTGSWISDHSTLYPAKYDSAENKYYYHTAAVKYNDDFEGMFNYCRDWMISRAAWLSKEMSASAVEEVNLDSQPATEAPATQPATEAPAQTINTKKLSLSLNGTKFVYTGKAVTPAATIKYTGGDKFDSGILNVKYPAGRKEIGTYTVVLYCKGITSPVASATFKIVPKTPSAKVKRAKKTATISWKKVSGKVTGYELVYGKTKSLKKTTKKSVKKVSVKIKKLKKTKAYYFRLRSYKTVNGKKIYSDWSKVKKIKSYKK